ncbi:putative F-box/LRR-repeat protein 23 [Apium graveolens]|uniref:putative F-box/LRR-repeat protein 23 n=1 Tax=Apium graveolens TaxID=4045 RepID=UPI003D7B235F
MVDINHLSEKRAYLLKMCMHAIDRSQGQLLDIKIERIARDELLKYLAENKRSNQLRRLRIAWGTDIVADSWSHFFQTSPLLEEISLAFTYISNETVIHAGKYCPKLKTFNYHMRNYKDYFPLKRITGTENEFVIAITQGMPQLRHLELIGNDMTNTGLQAILDGCPHLVSLDLRRCFNINMDGRCGKQCLEHIKDLRLPDDSIEEEDYEYFYVFCCEDIECFFEMKESFNWM